jgi:hypothetical protein
MRLLLTCTTILLASAVAFTSPADAAKRRSARAWQPAPVKDCTRINGRSGYYGNPWCTKAEQDAWDRATSRPVR